MKKIIILLITILPLLGFGQLTNTTFDSDISGWTDKSGATLSWDAIEGSAAAGSRRRGARTRGTWRRSSCG